MSFTGMSKIKKISLFIALISIFLLCSGFIVASQIKTVYQVSINGELIGEVSSPDVVYQWFEEQKNNFKSEYPEIQYETNESTFTFSETKRLNAKPQNNDALEKLQSIYEIKGQGVQIIVEDQIMGIVNDQNTADRIFNNLQRTYSISSKNLKVEQLNYNNKQSQYSEANDASVIPVSISFVEQVEILPIVTDPSEFISEEDMINQLKGTDIKPIKYVVKEGDCISCIAQKYNISQDAIYKNNSWIENDFLNIGDELDLTVKQPKLSVKTEEHYSEIVTVPSGVKITYDETLRVGVSKVINSGKDGKKKITYLVTKVNGELVEEVSIKEESLEKAIPKQVVQGSKIIKGVGTGSFNWPITGPKVTSEFGKRWGRLHAGTDAVSSDLNIYASDHGKVVTAEYNSSYGNHVIIDHQNGYQTLYAHLSKISIEEGELLEKGDVIGIMGTTGRSTGVHLHFEIQENNRQLNPLTFLEN